MARLLLAMLAILALTLSTPSRADAVSCIAFPSFHVPSSSYKIIKTGNTGECCSLCANGITFSAASLTHAVADDNCVAWTRDQHGRCALKNGAQSVVAAIGVDSGIKYRGAGKPNLVNNGVGATVLFVKADTPAPTHQSSGGGFRGNSVRASVRVTSTGGLASGTSTAGPRGASSFSSVQGSGSVETSATTPSVSLGTSLSQGDKNEKAKIAVSYYKNPSVVGEVTIITGQSIPVVKPVDGTIYCYTCSQYPCPYTKGLSFKKNGQIVADLTANSRDECCRFCRNNPQCVSWWYSAKKRCVLNSNYPGRSSIETHVGGVYL